MSEKHIAVVVLAAGRSSRMGAPKQLLEIEGKTLLRRTVETVLAARGHARVVFGFQAQELHESLRGLPISSLLAHKWEIGLSESVRTAVSSVWAWNHLYEPRERPAGFAAYNAILFVPCDLPLLSAEHLDALVEAYQAADVPLVVSAFDGVLGIPALFDESLWEELLELQGDEGARKIIQRHWEKAVAVPFEGGQFDLDTPQDVEAFQRNFLSMS